MGPPRALPCAPVSDARPNPLYLPLTQRPTATTVTVRELIHKVQAGQLRVPRFQRPLRWQQSDVVELLDSIWRGYPVGSLLLWKRRADAERIRVGGASLEVPAVTDAWWVVDGQQRTTALAASLLELDHAGDARWVVRFDPEEQRFIAGQPPEERQGLDVPVAVLGDLRRLGRWLRKGRLSEEATSRAEEAQQRLLDYAIPVYVVETDEEQALRAVFARLNSAGARMRTEEVFQALLGAPSADARDSLDLDELQRRCEAEGFGAPPRAEILKAVLAISGLDPSRRLQDLTAQQSLPAMASSDEVSEALSRTAAFLREDCGIVHYSLIPYPVVFFILARWFHLYPRTPGPTRALLARWVWRGAASGAHQRAEVSRMRDQVRAIRTGDEQGSLDRLLATVGAARGEAWSLQRFNLKSARSRIEVLALLAEEPRDRWGPIRVAELIQGGRVAREVFRAADWEGLPEEARSLAQTAANRVLLGPAHTGLSAELRAWGDAGALRSHLIDARAAELLRGHEVVSFLHHRAAMVSAAVGRLIARRAAWDEPELRPLSTYFEHVSDEGAEEEAREIEPDAGE